MPPEVWSVRSALYPPPTTTFGIAPARAYIPELLDDVLEARINPGRVFDFETNLEGLVEAYKAMDERRAIKSLIRIAAA